MPRIETFNDYHYQILFAIDGVCVVVIVFAAVYKIIYFRFFFF